MDMEFAQNGDLYMLEYGSGWFTANDDARLIRIEYNGGNRKPQLRIAANQMGGAIPFILKLSSEGTFDADNDALSYTWTVTPTKGKAQQFKTPNAELTLTKIGTYQVTLTVNDGKGGVTTQSMEVTAGNEPPVLSLDMSNSNKTFYVPNRSFKYDIKVTDKEDGKLGEGIDPENVAVTIDYLPEGFDKNIISMGHRSADANSGFATGRKLIEASDCMACHSKEKKSIGPSYRDIASKYKGDKAALELLTKKIISGGSGVWGETAMAGHPALSTTDASEMVKYILNIANETPKAKALPVHGSYEAKAPASDKNKGVYIVRAAYEDQGANGLPALRSEQTFVLRNAKVDAHGFDIYQDVNKMAFGGNNLAIPSKSGAYMLMKQIDLKGIKAIDVYAAAPKPQLNAKGGKYVVRLGSPTGVIIGESVFLEATEAMDFSPKTISAVLDLSEVDTDKLQDIYLVFLNNNDPEGSLMVMMGAEMKLLNEGEQMPTTLLKKASNADYYADKWQVVFLGTPQGDVKLNMNVVRENGKLEGEITSESSSDVVKATKIEEKDGGIKVFATLGGFNLNFTLEKQDEENAAGSLMGMFNVKASRMK